MTGQFGPYRVEKLIARGGMGEVLRAYDTRHDRMVALKLLHPHFAADKEFQKRFRREAHAVARLCEPHVVPIHSYGEIDGRLYLDMRLVEGEDLSDRLARLGPLAPADAVDVVNQMSQALGAAHAEGLVHRDVKPSNIILTETGFAYLVDFGIARSLDTDSGLTSTGAAIGTLDYMAPERFTGAPLDSRVDVYSLACVLHQCLTGSKPFAGTTAASLINAHLNQTPPKPSNYLPQLPTELDRVVARGMAKDPAGRYPTAAALAAAAQAALRTSRGPATAIAAGTQVLPTAEQAPRRSAAPWLVAVAVTVLTGVGTLVALPWLTTPDSTDRQSTAPIANPARTTTSGASAVSTPTSAVITPGTTRPSPPAPDDVADFVTNYYRMMPDTAAGWELIGPNLRLRTRDSYEKFWSKFSSAEVLNRPTVNGSTATVRLTLRYRDGRPSATETHSLGIASCNGHLCIDSDTVITTR